jgi:hypothetical protein
MLSAYTTARNRVALLRTSTDTLITPLPPATLTSGLRATCSALEVGKQGGLDAPLELLRLMMARGRARRIGRAAHLRAELPRDS